MTDRLILFSAPIIRRLLTGNKTEPGDCAPFPEASGESAEMIRVATDSVSGRSVYELKDAGGQRLH